MILFEPAFALFAITVLILYYTVFRHYQWQLLLVGSLFFYIHFTKSFFILFSILNTYLFGLWIHRTEEKKKRKTLVTLCLLLNFGLLFLLKYSPLLENTFGLLIPLGISFYMFQSVSYVIDVHRRKISPERNLGKFALFVAYFPQVIQGPIGRYGDLAPQLLEEHPYDEENFRHGFMTIAFGAFKKLFVADKIAPFVIEIFKNYEGYGGVLLFLGAFAYSIQIYTDFSGGIDIVRGLSQMMGITMAENFRRPFLSESVADFWRRWHITLGTWMKDYVFYSLNLSAPMIALNKRARKLLGRKRGKLLTICVSTYILYFLVGIWHGAGTNYVFYGLWNGTIISLALYLESDFAKVRKSLGVEGKRWYRIFAILRTNLLVTFGRYFVRSATAMDAFRMFRATFTNFTAKDLHFSTLSSMGYTRGSLVLLGIAVALVALVDLLSEKEVDLREEFDQWPAGAQFLLIFGVTALFSYVFFFSEGYVTTEFIYRKY